MSDGPLVSVIIPTYNCRPWIGQAIDSVLAQTYPNLEIIVVDDGSADGTGDYLREKYGERIKYIYQANGGPSRARNRGLAEAGGEFIQFLDADDWLLPEKIARQVYFLQERTEYGVVYCDFWCARDEATGNLLPPTRPPEGLSGDLFSRLLSGNIVVPHALLLRRACFEAAGDFNEAIRGTEDWEMWARLAGAGFFFGYLDERLIVYRLREGSVSRNTLEMRLSRHRMCAAIQRAVPASRLAAALKNNPTAAAFKFGLARAAFERRAWSEGYRQAGQALRSYHYRRWSYSIFILVYLALLPLAGYRRLEWLLARLSAVKPGLRQTQA